MNAREGHRQNTNSPSAWESWEGQKLQDVEQEILLAVKGVRYGSVEVIIHDSRVVQIERKEKVRFDGKKR